MLKAWIVDWLINQAIAAVLRWLDANAPTSRIKAAPAPIVKPKAGPNPPRVQVRPKYINQTAPGTWNRQEGRWNE